MRISPMIFFYSKHPEADMLKTVGEVSALTHAHERCKMCCYVYVKLGLSLLNNAGADKTKLVKTVMDDLQQELQAKFSVSEVKLLERLYNIDEFIKISRDGIKSSGYVVDTLEASLWCFLTTNNFKDCILKAVNLGDDADTVAAIAGALAGLYYGCDEIPKEWMDSLLGKENIYINCVADKIKQSLYIVVICKLYFLSLIPKRVSTALRRSGLKVRSLLINCCSFSVNSCKNLDVLISGISSDSFKNMSMVTPQKSAMRFRVITSGIALPCSQPLKHCLVTPILLPNSV